MAAEYEEVPEPQRFGVDIDGYEIIGRARPKEYMRKVVRLDAYPWYFCRICRFSYRIPDDIYHRCCRDSEYQRYAQRIVRKSMVTHVCSHLIYDRVQTLELGLKVDEEPVKPGYEVYLNTFVFYSELSIAVIRGIREDAVSMAVGDNGGEHPLSEAYRGIVRRCDNAVMYRYGGDFVPSPILSERLTQKTMNRHPLKPWKDPESLFCDTEFLTKLLGKELRKGEECRDYEKE